MNPTLAQTVSFALDVAMKATLVFAVTAALLFALRRASAATRHLVGTFGLAAALLVPVLTLALPRVRLGVIPDFRPVPATAMHAAAPAPAHRIAKASPARKQIAAPAGQPIEVEVVAPAMPAVAAAPDSPRVWRRLARAVPERDMPAADSPATPSPAPRPLRIPSAGLLLAVAGAAWALGAIAFVVRLAVGWVRVRQIARDSSPVSDAEWLEERDAAAARLELSRDVPLVESEAVPVAVTSGWRRPLLLIGRAARTWAVERKRVVLLHELAHVKRADWPALLVAEMAVAVYWFHPAAWYLGRRVRRDAEQACDDLVIASGTKPSVYAGHLLGIFRALHSPAHPVAPALAIVRPNHFEERLRAILDPVCARGAASGVTARLAAAGLFAAAVSFSAVEPWKPAATDVPSSPSIAASSCPSHAHAKVKTESKEDVPGFVAVLFRKAEKKIESYRFEQKTQTRQRTETRVEKTACPLKKEQVKVEDEPALDADAAPDSSEAKSAEAPEAGPDSESAPASVPAVLQNGGKAPVAPKALGFVTASNRKHSGNDWYGRGMDLHNDENYEAAIEAFKKSIEDGYREDAASYNIACGYARLGNSDAAFEWLKKAMDAGFDVASYLGRDDDLDSLKSDPRWAQTKKEARAQEGSKSAREAKAASSRYERLVAKNPKSGEAFFENGLELLRADEYDLAAKSYQQAIDRNYRTATAYYNQACAYAQNGDKDRAFDSLRKALDAGFDQPDTLAKDDDLENLHGDPRFSALKKDARELELPGYSNGYWGHRASERAKWRNAAKRFEEYVQKNPNSGRGWYSLGFAELAGERPEASVEAFQKALALGYRKPTTMYNIACAYARLDQKDPAFEWLFKALEAGFDSTGTIRNDEDLDNLRGDARFRKALSIARDKERDGENQSD
ncbi:MAG TPA: M56 family metallopeptidase [Thermoanaerobaculia bacterium]|nr:M56 family metallopeptidase [Thermoanaerobaculia bacterium]